MRAVRLVMLALSLSACGPSKPEIVGRDGDWELTRSPRSSENNRLQYRYDLKFRGRSVRVAGDLYTPLGTFTMSAPTDRRSDEGWLRVGTPMSFLPTTERPVSGEEIQRGYYATTAPFRRAGTPRAWVFQ